MVKVVEEKKERIGVERRQRSPETVRALDREPE